MTETGGHRAFSRHYAEAQFSNKVHEFADSSGGRYPELEEMQINNITHVCRPIAYNLEWRERKNKHQFFYIIIIHTLCAILGRGRSPKTIKEGHGRI